MARILVPRGSSAAPAASASSNSNSNPPHRSSSASSASSAPPSQSLHSSVPVNDEELTEAASELVVVDDVSEQCGAGGDDHDKAKSVTEEAVEIEKACSSSVGGGGLRIFDRSAVEREGSGGVNALQMMSGDSYPPPPPVPPPKPSVTSSNIVRRFGPGSSNSIRTRRAVAWPVVSPSGSRPSSPRSHGDGEGYNSADEQNPCFGSSYDDAERERQFELDIRRATGLEVKRMLEDGNCLFRAVADQVYGDSEVYDLTRQMCIDYMERERDHFSQFITEGFTSYCKRKRRDKVYGNNVEIQALSEMYNRPIHIYSCSTEPINIFHGSYDTDTPPIRLSYHHGNHYNSLVDPCRLTIGAGLGFSSLRGRNIDKEQVKAAIKAQQDQQIDKALLAEGRFYSDIELTEKEMERMVMEASRAEYLAADKFKRQASRRESSTSGAEPSSSGARPSGSDAKKLKEGGASAVALSSSMQMVLSMGFSYLQVIEAYSIFGDDVDSVVCYLLETGNSSRRKGKATE